MTPTGIAAAGGLVTNTAINLGTNHLTVTTIKPVTNSTSGVTITKADGVTSVLNVDTTNGKVGIGTTTPEQKLDVDGTIKSSGSVIGNTALLSTFRTVSGASAIGPFAQVLGTTGETGIGIARFASTEFSGNFYFAKSRGATVGTYTLVQDGDSIGQFIFEGSDGTDFGAGASFGAYVDGTPGNDDMPGRLVFFTSPDGTQVPVERMTIKSTGNIGLGTNAPAAKLHVVGSAIIETNLTVNGAINIKGTNITDMIAASTNPIPAQTAAAIANATNAIVQAGWLLYDAGSNKWLRVTVSNYSYYISEVL
jgi:hypothetical protein